MRAGAHALSLLSVPLNVHAMQALAERPLSLVELRRAVGSPPQTTIRGQLRILAAAGVVERCGESGVQAVSYKLTRQGEELLAVAEVLRAWLLAATEGPIQLTSVAARSSTKALAEGWSSAIVRALAARPLSLTELSRLISGFSYPTLERRLGAMRMAGLVESRPGNGRGTPYAVTDWLRRAIAPIAAAARWERRHLPAGTEPIRRIDIEAAFLLALPLTSLPEDRSGTCRLAVHTSSGAKHHRAGVVVGVESGRIVSCVTRLDAPVDASIAGSASTWINAVLERDGIGLKVSGRRRLALALEEGIHQALVG